MRFKVLCTVVKGDSFSQDYHRNILSMLKSGLDRYEEIFKEFFGSNKQKKYCWSVFFKNSRFEKDRILLQGEKKEFIINFSILNNNDAINIYNAFINIKGKHINISDNLTVKVANITILPAKEVKGISLKGKTMSPIVCRDHNQETQEDTYYTGNDDKFVSILKRNLYLEMKNEYGEYIKKDIEDLIIKTENLKKNVVKFYGKFIDTSIGTMCLEGKNYLLNYIYSSGLGSLRGSGYGLLEITP